jgi:hypothetical protein
VNGIDVPLSVTACVARFVALFRGWRSVEMLCNGEFLFRDCDGC